jgi:hypothetical protein
LLGYVSWVLGCLYAAGEWLSHYHERLTWGQRFRVFLALLLAAFAALVPSCVAGDSDLAFKFFITPGGLMLAGLLFVLPYVVSAPYLVTAGFLLQVVAGSLLLPVIIFLSLVTAPFGIDAGLLAGIFELSAETTPPGNFSVFQIQDSLLPGLRHSLTYGDDATLDAIVNWIVSR